VKVPAITGQDPAILVERPAVLRQLGAVLAEDTANSLEEPANVSQDGGALAAETAIHVERPAHLRQDRAVLAEDPVLLAEDPALHVVDPAPSVPLRDAETIAKLVAVMGSLAARFVAHVVGAAPPAFDDLERELERFLEAARAPWAALPLDTGVFVQHVAERSIDGRLPPVTHAADLYLACACAHDVAGAHRAFDGCYAEAIARAVARKNPSAAFVDEATQRLREHLFVSSHGLPKIADYGGRAALRTWLTIAASREALMLLRGEGRRRETTEADEALAADYGPELDVLKRRYAGDFAAALEEAFARLSDKERTILQFHVVDRLGIDGLAELYKVGRSTAARWLASARTTLVDETRGQLRRKLDLTDSEYDSLAVLVRSQLDVSVARLLGRRSR
jgi:RNA polymerase sigma-70 factor (ECF subfamily)